MNYALETIRQYLNTPKASYAEGVALLQSYGNKPATCELLLQHQDKPKLLNLLNALFAEMETADAPVAVNATVTKKPVSIIFTPQENLPVRSPGETQLYGELKQGIKQIDAIKQNLFFIGRNPATGEERPLTKQEEEHRLELAKMLVGKSGLNDTTIELMEDIRYLRTYGKPRKKESSEDAAPAPIGDGDVYLKKENARKQCSKLRGKVRDGEAKMKNMQGDALEKMSSKVAAWRQELKAQEEILESLKALFDGSK